MQRKQLLSALAFVLVSGGLLPGQDAVQPMNSAPNPYPDARRLGDPPAGTRVGPYERGACGS